jgi:hypothetical protein
LAIVIEDCRLPLKIGDCHWSLAIAIRQSPIDNPNRQSAIVNPVNLQSAIAILQSITAAA